MKNIILFKSNDVCHNSLNYWVELLGKSLEKYGIDCFEIEFVYEELSKKLPKILAENNIDAAIVFNSNGQERITIEHENIWDKYGIPFFNYLIDHPLEHADNLMAGGKNSNYNVICIDKGHVQFIKRYLKEIEKVNFLPLMGFGTENDELVEYDSFMSRKYEVSITMGLYPLDLLNKKISEMSAMIQEYIFDWVSAMELNLDDAPETCLLNVLENKFGKENVTDELFIKVACQCRIAIPYFRTAIRERIVEGLIKNGVGINIFGDGWDGLRDSIGDGNAVFHGEVRIDETAEIYRNTKLALNILPLFKYGSHDRIPTAQINGAAVLSDENYYLKELYNLSGKREIYLFNLKDNEGLSERIIDILSDKQKLFEVARNGQKYARSRLTWDEGTLGLLKLFNELNAIKK